MTHRDWCKKVCREEAGETALTLSVPAKAKQFWQRAQNTMPDRDGECNQSQWPS